MERFVNINLQEAYLLADLAGIRDDLETADAICDLLLKEKIKIKELESVKSQSKRETYSVYEYDNQIYKNPTTKPLYKEFPSWNTVTDKNPLKDFIKYIELETGIPVTLVSFGKERDEIWDFNK